MKKYFKKLNNNVWTGAVALAVVFALGLWWLSSVETVDTSGLPGAPKNDAKPAQQGRSAPTATTVASSDVVSIVGTLSGSSEFAALLSSTGVSSEIRSTGQYTIFVPSDAALSTSGMTSEEKKRLVRYHIISGRAIDPEAVKSGSVESLSRDMLNFEVTNGVARVNGQNFLQAYRGKNGVVFTVSGVLHPPIRR